MIKITECPRDAMQGLKNWVPTETKVRYLNALMKIGFDVLDFGSFVSPKAVPQMQDTAEVVEQIEASGTKLLAIIANERGAHDALLHPAIDILGYPLSVSETFQLRNTNKTTEQSLDLVKRIKEKTDAADRDLLIYFSMGFGNPYGDPYSPEVLLEFADKMKAMDIRHIRLADTTGEADLDKIPEIFRKIMTVYPEMEFGAHFHAHPAAALTKIEKAWEGGCRVFDVAMGGYGGCPFAEDTLVGNISTQALVEWCKNNGVELNINDVNFRQAEKLLPSVFNG